MIERSVLHAVVYYPHLRSRGLNEFRRKYDPFAELLPEHLTLVFPIPVALPTMRDHVRAVATETDPFEIEIGGLERTWDHWLFLGFRQGHAQVVALHDRLYSGPLREYLRTDLPFEPHIGIGFFGKGPYDPLDRSRSRSIPKPMNERARRQRSSTSKPGGRWRRSRSSAWIPSEAPSRTWRSNRSDPSG